MASALPKEVRYLNEPTTNIINKTIIIKNEDIKRIFPKTISKHLRVGTPSTTQLPFGPVSQSWI